MRLREADFYYGAILSMLFNHEICPALVEAGSDRQIYEFTTDEGDFILFLKYRSEAIPTKTADYQSWQFNFSENDIEQLSTYIAGEKHLSVGLICGVSALKDSEYAVLHKDEMNDLFKAEKESLTVSRKKGERAFRVSRGGGRGNAMRIESNRLY